MSGLEILAGVGLATQIGTSIFGAESKADAAEREAALKYMQADELLQRQAINEQYMREQADEFTSNYRTAWAGTGRGGGGISGALKIKSDTERAIANSRRDAEFKAKMLRMGAQIDTDLASDTRVAGYLGAGSILTRGAAGIWSRNRGPGSSKDLIEV